MAVVWHQVVFALYAKYNALRSKNHPNFRNYTLILIHLLIIYFLNANNLIFTGTLYIRRRNQLLREFGTCKEHGFWKQYLKIRGILLQNRYGLALDQTSLRRQSINQVN